MDYGSGLLIALLMWAVGTIHSLVQINSKMERNLNKVGQRLSWVTLTPKEMSPDDLTRSIAGKILRFAAITLVGLLSTLTSWVYVILALGFFAYSKSKDIGAPEAVKAFRWRMRNMDLPRDQIIQEMMRVAGQDSSQFQQVQEELLQGMRERGLKVY